MALHKFIAYQYNKKRNLNLTTPCCSKAIAMASLPLLLLAWIYGIVIPVAKQLASYSFKDENGNEFIWNDLQSKWAEYKYFTKLLQSCCRNNKTHCKGHKVHSRALFGTTTLFLKITCCSISIKHIAMTK
jgi:hypothetical protein